MNEMLRNKKIAIVYDWFDTWGGVERVLLTLHEIFPHAIFYTSYCDKKKAAWAKNLTIHTSFIQRLPPFVKKNRILSFPFFPFAFESFDFSSFDLVISISSLFAKSAITKPGTLHICYLLTPPRYLWFAQKLYFATFFKKIFSRLFLARYKKYDSIAANRPDFYISISKTVARRAKTFYQRDSEVIYPPFDTDYWNSIIPRPPSHPPDKFRLNRNKPFFLIVSRLEPYKRVDFAISVFNKLKKNVIIVGKGSEEKKLKKQAHEYIRFMHDISDEELAYLYAHAKAFIMPQDEDFGYVSLEAQFFGCPVIAFGKGGSLETISEGKTGVFFDEQTPLSLSKTLEKFHTISYTIHQSTREHGKKWVQNYGKDRFIQQFLGYVNEKTIV